MNKLFIILAVILFIAVLLVSRDVTAPKQMDERITLKHTDNLPYGTSAARAMLNHVYPDAQVHDSRYHPHWQANGDTGTAIFLMADHLSATENDLQQMLQFISSGNTVFIAARSFSSESLSFFGIVPSLLQPKQHQRGLYVKLNGTYFKNDSLFTYPGLVYNQPVQAYDSEVIKLLGTDGNGRPNFFELKKGRGRLFVHTAPLAFSNYFILHKQNVKYFEQVISVLPNPQKIEWNEWNLYQQEVKQAEGGWLSGLLQHQSFRWSFYMAMGALMCYLLLGMRRQQRMIPEWPAPKNETLQFISTLGQLYFERSDHKNLAEKLASYFLLHVRSHFRLSTQAINEDFNISLALKSGHSVEFITSVTSFISGLPEMQDVSEQQLAGFYQQLSLFYKKTH